MHVGERDEEILATQQRMRRRPRCVGGSWLFCVTTSVAATCIYKEHPPRVTASRNRLGLSLSKHIRHGLVAKINGKRKPQTCKPLDRISVNYSLACRAPAPIALPCYARRAERARVCVSLSHLLYTFACA
jgi:hypothetical protein